MAESEPALKGVTFFAWREGHYLDLTELLRILERFVEGLTWRVRFDDVAPGPTADSLEALGPDVRLPTAELLERVSPSDVQVIDGVFRGYRLPGDDSPSVVLRAVRSTSWDVEAENEALLDFVRSTFPDTQDIPWD